MPLGGEKPHLLPLPPTILGKDFGHFFGSVFGPVSALSKADPIKDRPDQKPIRID